MGYPGIVYAEGPHEAVVFVRNVKGMQWLALRVQFMEPVPVSDAKSGSVTTTSRDPECSWWMEVSKISEVLEQMKIRERESLVTNLGIPRNETRISGRTMLYLYSWLEQRRCSRYHTSHLEGLLMVVVWPLP